MIAPATPRAACAWNWSLALLMLALLGLVLTAPALFAEPMTYASFWIDHVWIDQFAAELARGSLYPRWLPRSHDGLGAPVFHYYAPLAFYAGAAFKLAGLSAYGAVIATFAAAWIASGAAMLRWIGDAGRRGLIAAALYMAFPYHILDFYRRGSLAEFCVYPLVPLLALALRRAGEGRGFGWLAIAYAALTLTHLPMALVTSLLLVAPYGLWLVKRRRDAWRPIGAGLTLGLGLSAAYLLPALTLQHLVLIERLWSVGELQPANWSFFVPGRWPDRPSVLLLIALTAALALLAIPAALRRERWALWSIAVAAIVAGVVPGLWSLPIVEKVQFPWRALVLVEFGVATAIARTRVKPALTAAALVPVLVLSVALLRPAGIGNLSIADLARHPDVLEYLPADAPTREFGGTFSQWALDLSKRPAFVTRPDGVTIARRFYNPAWQVSCRGGEAATFAEPQTRLLAFRGRDCAIRWRKPAVQRIGEAISALGLLLLGLLTGRSRLRPRG